MDQIRIKSRVRRIERYFIPNSVGKHQSNERISESYFNNELGYYSPALMVMHTKLFGIQPFISNRPIPGARYGQVPLLFFRKPFLGTEEYSIELFDNYEFETLIPNIDKNMDSLPLDIKINLLHCLLFEAEEILNDKGLPFEEYNMLTYISKDN